MSDNACFVFYVLIVAATVVLMVFLLGPMRGRSPGLCIDEAHRVSPWLLANVECTHPAQRLVRTTDFMECRCERDGAAP